MVEVSKVPLLDLRRNPPDVDGALSEAFRRVMESGQYILGPEVEALEAEMSAYIGVRHALGVSSGTDALLLALMALGVGPGDEVICPTYTFFATAGSVWRIGAKPVFVDSCLTCYNLLPQQVAAKCTSRTKAIIPVHLFGQCADMDSILELSANRGIPVIEDAAQAIGARDRGRGAGSMGAFGCFSFFPSKNLGGFGDSGLVTTNDDVLAEKARVLRAHGGRPKYHHRVVGANFRMDALQAALIRVKLQHLDAYTERRNANADSYTERLLQLGTAGPATGAPCSPSCRAVLPRPDTRLLLPQRCRERHVFNQYVLRAGKHRDALQAFLKKRGVGSEVYYPVPMHLQECFAKLGHRVGDFPNSEAAARETLAIPIFPELTSAELEYVSDQIVAYFRASPVEPLGA